jgi:hypothetical protein
LSLCGIPVTLDDFKRSAANAAPPKDLSQPLLALWHDARGDWDGAHEIAQAIPDPVGAWIHAYLHRKEGDLGNAGYWYRRAGKPECRDPLAVEWERIADALIAGS